MNVKFKITGWLTVGVAVDIINCDDAMASFVLNVPLLTNPICLLLTIRVSVLILNFTKIFVLRLQ